MNNNILSFEFNSGFFSTCTVLMRHIVAYHNQYKILPFIDSKKLWNTYKDIDIDIYNSFFEFNQNISSNSPSYFSTSVDEDQFSNFSLINYDYTNIIVNKYFLPAKIIIDIKQNLIDKYNIDIQNTISVCYRGNDKKRETNLPTYDEMLFKINEIKNKFPNKKLLIQTDELDFCEFMSAKFSDLIFINETKKIRRADTAIQYTVPQGERVITAQNFLATMYLISETSSIILNSGSVGMWICLFRQNCNNIYQYLNPFNNPNPPKWIN